MPQINIKDLREAAERARAGARPAPPGTVKRRQRRGVFFVIVFLIAGGLLILWAQWHRSAPNVPTPVPEVAADHQWAVAAVNANLRALSTGGPEVGMLGRGARLVEIESSTTHLKVRTETGQIAWIARAVVIPYADFSELRNQTAQSYLNSRLAENRMTELVKQLEPYDRQVDGIVALLQAGNVSADAVNALRQIDQSRHVDIKPDSSAATWFGYAGEVAAKRGRHMESRANYQAAHQADPADAGYATGVAFEDLRLKDMVALKNDWRVLPVLAPLSSNTWFLAGIVWASDDNVPPARAVSAFRLALTLSTAPLKTRKYLLAQMNVAKDPRISTAIFSALQMP